MNISGQLLPIAFTSTSIYVVFIVFLLDKYIEFQKQDDPVTEMFFVVSVIVLIAFGLGIIATVVLLYMTLGVLSSEWLWEASLFLLLSVVILALGTFFLGAAILHEYQPKNLF